MGHAKGKMKVFQHSNGLGAEPGLIPELEGMAMVFGSGEGGQKDAEFLQSLLLKLEPRRKLPEDRAQFLSQGRCMVEEKRNRFPAIL